MVPLSVVLGIVGNITAFVGLVSPMPTFWRIMRNGCTGSFSAQPYLFSLMSSLFWAFYGILEHNGIFVVTISATSAFFIFYLSIYIWFTTCPQRRKVFIALLAILLSYMGVIVSTLLLKRNHHYYILIVGILSIISSIVSTAATLTIVAIKEGIHYKE
ncbi:hypothetical protein GOP47_0011802 [Adiantum capillus-veneris]|uniref:Uncharacterized protein n=1 Tax=Adiantum capillus-veneris TaxID=13818 RepID=A0A9D4UTG0_ADICA|nr:hypothetical protein GOP47_0011802 [Adiantum capillus-veneris]